MTTDLGNPQGPLASETINRGGPRDRQLALRADGPPVALRDLLRRALIVDDADRDVIASAPSHYGNEAD